MAALRTIMRGRVVKIDAAANNLPWVTVPELGVERQIGPCLTIRGDTLAVGDTVLCVATEGTHDDLTVIGKFGPPLEAVATFSELTDVDWSTPPADGQGFVWDDASDKLKPHSSHLVSASEPSATGRRAGDLWIDPTPAGPSAGQYLRSAQTVLRGARRRKVTTTGVGWHGKMYTRGAGRRSTLAPSGWHEIAMPLAGTAIQKVGGSPATATVTDDTPANATTAIPLAAGESLWYSLPLGSAFGTAGTFFITVATPTVDFEIPESWVLICSRTMDYPTNDGCSHIWGDGREQSFWTAASLIAPVVNYGAVGAGHTTARWKKEGGWVEWIGLIKGGIVGSRITYLPDWYNDQSGDDYDGVDKALHSTVCAGGWCRIDTNPTEMIIVGAQGDVTGWCSLTGVRYWNG